MARILAVSSGGGHWQQLKLLDAAMEDAEVVYACSADVGEPTVLRVPDCNLRTPRRLVLGLLAAWRLVRSVRPDVVVSTGAAPGALALIVAKLLGCRTVWIDSIANAECMSLSGRLTRCFADLWMTQWETVSERSGAVYVGAVL
ncbi:oligosaccharide biosynthesis protein Alg14 [Litoreibacter meonggei]|uniref:Oligosaccharide biosynthesis protein Alg14 n=1 Tax=Litoreibacter meonggei TaxID=1049199 RepID=A0A497VR54_9RHOB|nr:UDP-N-acetylglucosamine--LPS N-acetylglucosamine transferase [Litoreibacter meonggei]RLJ41434.1 oligosaccharide biosynthesis protein Alg14 [Litoreibacter meonggei]